MRRYTLTIGDRTFTIDVEETAADRFEVSVDGRRFEASLQGDEDLPGVVITPGPASRDGHDGDAASPAGPVSAGTRAAVGASTATGPGGTATGPGGTTATAAGALRSVAAPRRPAPGRPPRRAVDVISAPMPGVVLDVLVAPDQAIRRGDPLLVLEAMKMRNTIRSPRDAVVVEVAVEAGRPVAPGDPLVRLREPDG